MVGIWNDSCHNSDYSKRIDFQVSMIRSNFLLSQSYQRVILFVHIQKLYHSPRNQVVKSQVTCLQLIHHLLSQQNTTLVQNQQRTDQPSRVSVDHNLSKLFILALYHRYVHEFFNQPLSPHQTDPIHQISIVSITYQTTVQYHPISSPLRNVALDDPQILDLKVSARSCNASSQRQIFHQTAALSVRSIAGTYHTPMRPQQSTWTCNLSRLFKLRIETSDHTNG